MGVNEASCHGNSGGFTQGDQGGSPRVITPVLTWSARQKSRHRIVTEKSAELAQGRHRFSSARFLDDGKGAKVEHYIFGRFPSRSFRKRLSCSILANLSPPSGKIERRKTVMHTPPVRTQSSSLSTVPLVLLQWCCLATGPRGASNMNTTRTAERSPAIDD